MSDLAVLDGNTSTSDLATADLSEQDAPWIPAPVLGSLNFDQPVTAAVHAGDAWFIGGRFDFADMIPARDLVALDSTGQPTGCSVGRGFEGGFVRRIVHVGNALFAAGTFTSYQGASAKGIAKIDATTCALDTTFSPPANNGFDADVRALAYSGSAIYAGGLFTTYRGQSANRIAKIDPVTGALDTTFSPPANNGFDGDVDVLLATATDVYAGGAFATYRNVANSANRIARLDPTTGALVSTFGPAGATSNGFDAIVASLAINGTSLYVGGQFASYKNVANSARRVAKIDTTTGALDTTFSPGGGSTANGFDNVVNVIELFGNALFVGGAFDGYRGVAASAHRIAKLDATSGALDTTFSPPASNGFAGNIFVIKAISTYVLVGGAPLGGYRGSANVPGGIAKVDQTSGVLEAGYFTPAGHDRPGLYSQVGGALNAVEVVGTTIWLGGDFTHIGGKSAHRIARIKDSDGKLDTTFSPSANNGFDSDVVTLAASSGALYVGGEFTKYRGVAGSASHLAKLDLGTGAEDTTFSPVGTTANGFDGRVDALLVDGNTLYAGGGFSTYRGVADSAHGLAKLDATTGALDTTFSPPGATANGVDDDVLALAKDGTSLYVGGAFQSYRGGTLNANRIAKLDAATGALDTTFSPQASNGFDSDVNALVALGGNVFAGGSFSAYRGGAGVLHLAKLAGSTGALDTVFTQPGATSGFDGDVNSLAVSGGALFAGGAFVAYRGVAASASFLAKLDTTSGALNTAFTPTGALSGSSDSIAAVVPFQSALFLGGSFASCDGARCYTNANRVNWDTRTAE